MIPKSLPYREGKNIVIYDARIINQCINPPRHIIKDIFRGASFMCFILAIFGVTASLMPIAYAEIATTLNKNHFKSQLILEPKNQVATEIPNTNATVPLANPDTLTPLNIRENQLKFLKSEELPSDAKWDFSLLIPKIGLNTAVFANIDPTDKTEYMNVLKQGVAHAKFTSLPSEEGIVYIFGHSTDYPWNIKEYNALFYSIKDLTEGDRIIILYNNKAYVYKTLYQKIIDDDNLVYLNAKTNAKMLVLQTCWPPGTTLKRLIVVANLENIVDITKPI
jgi:LPXTG-site transpeptidase (sortase) family protein